MAFIDSTHGGFPAGIRNYLHKPSFVCKEHKKTKVKEGGKTVRRDKGKFDTKAKDLYRACENEHN